MSVKKTVAASTWLLIRQVREILGGTDDVWPTLAATILNPGLVVLAFAWVYRMIGITGTSIRGARDARWRRWRPCSAT